MHFDFVLKQKKKMTCSSIVSESHRKSDNGGTSVYVNLKQYIFDGYYIFPKETSDKTRPLDHSVLYKMRCGPCQALISS